MVNTVIYHKQCPRCEIHEMDKVLSENIGNTYEWYCFECHYTTEYCEDSDMSEDKTVKKVLVSSGEDRDE